MLIREKHAAYRRVVSEMEVDIVVLVDREQTLQRRLIAATEKETKRVLQAQYDAAVRLTDLACDEYRAFIAKYRS